MGINPSQAPAIQTSFLKKMQNLVMLSHWSRWKRIKQIQNFISIPKIPAGQLTNHEWVAKNGTLLQ